MSLLGLVFRGILGAFQVISIVVVAFVAQKPAQTFEALFYDAICSVLPAAAAAEASYLAENDAAMKRMMSDMAVKPTGDVDRDFVSMMSPHHQGAIDMARAVLRYGRNEQIRRLAQEIIVTQQQEIAVMRLAIGDPLTVSAPAQAQVASSSGRP